MIILVHPLRYFYWFFTDFQYFPIFCEPPLRLRDENSSFANITWRLLDPSWISPFQLNCRRYLLDRDFDNPQFDQSGQALASMCCISLKTGWYLEFTEANLLTIVVESIFLGWQIVIKCNPFILFLVSLECVKGVIYFPRQRPKFRSRKNQVQSKKTKILSLWHQLDTWLDRSRFSITSLTLGSTDWECSP